MRASRLVSALLLLQSRGRLTAAELAHELEVSERTIYRDLADLGAAGVPVYGERGEGGGYQLLDGYRTNLTGLTQDEASALLLSGAPKAAAELGLGSLLATTRLKLLAAIPPAMKDMATRAEQRFLLDPTIWVHQRPRENTQLRTIAQAVWQDRQLRLLHQRGDGRLSQRTVQPLGLVHKTGTWYLVASYRQQPLVFRVDRVRSADMLDAPADRPADFDLAAHWSRWEAEYAASLPTFSTTVRLGPHAQRYRDALGGLSPRGATAEPPDGAGWSRQELVFDRLEVAVAALLALSPDVEVLAPEVLRQELASVAHRAMMLNTP
jgi:predicted DNA-binding transcriptional regulator YafY